MISPFSDRVAFEQQPVIGRLQLEVVPYMEGRDKNPVFKGELLPYCFDPMQQVSVLGFINQRDKSVAEFQFKDIEQRRKVRTFLGFCALGLVDLLLAMLRFAFAVDISGKHKQDRADENQRNRRKTRNHTQKI